MDCTICCELLGTPHSNFEDDYARLVRMGQNVLLSTSRFAVIPSIGALHSSHALIVPRMHLHSFSTALDQVSAQELSVIKSVLSHQIRAHGDEPILFEHGMGDQSDCSGACMDHAHLHIVRHTGRFSEMACANRHFVGLPDFETAMNLADQHSGYALIITDNGLTRLFNKPGLPQQFFRQVYVEAARDSRNWNWRLDKRPDITRRVVEYYRGVQKLDRASPSESEGS